MSFDAPFILQKSLPVWQLAVQWCILNEPQQVESLFEVRTCISVFVQPFYST